MPHINQDKIVEKILTNNGEVTINLNLKISVVREGEIVVAAEAQPQIQPLVVEVQAPPSPPPSVEKMPLIIPDDSFDLDIPILPEFGRKS